MSAQLNITNHFEKLSEHNYDIWSILMKSVLVNADLWGIASGVVKNDSKPEWTNLDSKALATIILHISTSQLVHVKRCRTSWEAWEKLKLIHSPSNPIRKVSLYKKLLNLRMNELESVGSFVASFSELCDKLEETDIKLTDELMLLSNLPSEFDNFVIAIETRDSLPKFDAMKVKLLEEGERRSQKTDDTDQFKAQAFYAQNKERQTNKSRREPFKGKCYNCGKRGHMIQNCRNKKQATQQHANSQNSTHAAFMLSKAGIVNKKLWCVDSGATSHMCCDKDLFDSYVDQKQSISLAADFSTTSFGTGNINLKTRTSIIKLRNVLYVPSLHTNFLSVSKILQAGHIVQFKNKEAIIRKSSGEVLITASLSNGLFLCKDIVGEHLYAAQDHNTMIWHARYGHLNLQSLNTMAKENMVYGLNVLNTNYHINCDTCNKSKIAALPFKSTNGKKSSDILELIHSDVCGPMPKQSIGGARYFVTFIDDFSRKMFVYFIKSKDQVHEKFRIFKNCVECQTDKKIKILRSDNGGEYVNNAFNDYLRNCGIKHELTVPYTPQQNGVAERANRTLVEMARCMLVHANAPEALWAEAVHTAAYLRNRSSTKALDKITPHEAWCKRKPSISHLRTFGSRVYALDKTVHKKFSAKAKEYLFVGYSSTSKAYRLFDRVSMQIIERRDVRFVENCFMNGQNEIANNNEHQSYEFLLFPKTNENKLPILEKSTKQTTEIESDDESYSVANQNNANLVSQDAASDDGNVANATILEKVRKGGRPRIVRTGKPGRPKKVHHMINFSAEIGMIETPKTVSEALNGKHREQWLESMKQEFDALILNETWSLKDLPPNHKPIGTKWVFKIKKDENGKIVKFKSRLVAQGCHQQFGLNFWETFSPVIRYENIRLLFATAVEKELLLHQLDVSNAYLNGQLDEEIYLKQPEGFVDESCPNKVLKLRKAIYGLKQSGRVWNDTLNKTLINLGFKPCESEPCLYKYENSQSYCLMAIYVDDILIACDKNDLIENIKLRLSNEFKIHDSGPLKHFLGMEIKRDGDIGNIYVGHMQYIKDTLNNYNMSQCRPAATPLDPGFTLECKNENCKKVDATSYQSLVGTLMYLAITTRPDILYAICLLAQRNSDPHTEHEAAAYHILRYLSATKNLCLCFSTTGEKLNGFVDADWASNSEDRKSYSGYAFFLGGTAISWDSKKQTVVALSSTEAEYIALSFATREAAYLKNLSKEIGWLDDNPIVLNGDNISSHSLASNNTNHKRTKHIDIRYHHVRECIKNGLISLNYVPTTENVADLFTKLLNKKKHNKFLTMLGMKNF